MKNWRKVGATIGGLLLLLSFLAACGPSTSTTTGPAGTQPKAGGSVVDIYDEEPDSLLPWNTGETFGFMMQNQIWAPLLNTDINTAWTLEGSLLSEIPSQSNGGVSSDLKTFTFKLRPHLKWSDGSAETSADCVATFNYLSNPQVGDLGAFPTTDPNDTIGFVSVTAVDPQTFKIQLKNADGPFLGGMTGAPATCLPAAFISTLKGPADFGKSSWNFQPQVMNGPFMVKERVGGSHMTAVKNPNYFEGPTKPYLNQITDQIITDSNTELQAFQSGTADAGWFLDSTKLASYQALSGYTTSVDSGDGYEWLIYNLHDPILADKVVRQALQESIDPPNEIYQTLLHGTAKQTCDDAAGTWAHEPNLIPCYKFDQTDAGNILTSDGWVMGSDNYRHKNGQILELQYATTNLQRRENTQAIFIQDWQKIGIKVDQKNYSNSQDWFGTGALCQGKFQIGEFANSFVSPDPDDHGSFESNQLCLQNGGSNFGFYNNATVDQQELVQLQTVDQNARKAAFHIIHQQILQDIPVTYLFVAGNVSCHSARLQNYQPAASAAAESTEVENWWVTNA